MEGSKAAMLETLKIMYSSTFILDVAQCLGFELR
jgi:hypothetical protein